MIRSRGDTTVDLIDLVEDKTLDFGESTEVVEEEVVGVCLNAEIETVVAAKADPEEGDPCFAEDVYNFMTVVKERRVEAEITCVDSEGTDCDEKNNTNLIFNEEKISLNWLYKIWLESEMCGDL